MSRSDRAPSLRLVLRDRTQICMYLDFEKILEESGQFNAEAPGVKNTRMSCGVTDDPGKSVGTISYPVPKGVPAHQLSYSFVIQSSGQPGMEEGYCQITINGELLKEATSRPFRAGAFRKKRDNVKQGQYYVIDIEKVSWAKSDVLHNYFD